MTTTVIARAAGLALAALCAIGMAAPAVSQSEPAAPPETVATPAAHDDEAAPAQDTAHLMGLNKITARTHPMQVRVGEALRFGTLGIIVRACHKAKPEDPPKTIAFVEVREYPVNEDLPDEPEPIFSGWMLASSPGLNALEHPVYDVWLTDCSMSSAEGAAPSE